MSYRTRIVLPGALSGGVGALFGAVIWFFSNLPASPEPFVWQIALVSGTTFVSFHIGMSFRQGDDDGGTPELQSETVRQV